MAFLCPKANRGFSRECKKCRFIRDFGTKIARRRRKVCPPARQRENERNMNERSNERLQQAGTPTASPVAGNALGAETADQRDAAMASGLPAANGFAPATALSTAPAKRYPLWMQAVALILVVTLSLMSWNETTIAEARTMISGDAVPMASAPTGDEGDAEDAADDDQQDEGTAPPGPSPRSPTRTWRPSYPRVSSPLTASSRRFRRPRCRRRPIPWTTPPRNPRRSWPRPSPSA